MITPLFDEMKIHNNFVIKFDCVDTQANFGNDSSKRLG